MRADLWIPKFITLFKLCELQIDFLVVFEDQGAFGELRPRIASTIELVPGISLDIIGTHGRVMRNLLCDELELPWQAKFIGFMKQRIEGLDYPSLHICH